MDTKDTIILSVRVHKSRRQRIQMAAEKMGMTPSDYLRYLVVGITDAVITADSPSALEKKFVVLAEIFSNIRLAVEGKKVLEGSDETEQEP